MESRPTNHLTFVEKEIVAMFSVPNRIAIRGFGDVVQVRIENVELVSESYFHLKVSRNSSGGFGVTTLHGKGFKIELSPIDGRAVKKKCLHTLWVLVSDYKGKKNFREIQIFLDFFLVGKCDCFRTIILDNGRDFVAFAEFGNTNDNPIALSV